jgi:hemoglobin
METRSLYQRLGGYDAIAAAVDDLLPRLTSDPQLGVYWRGHSKDSMTTSAPICCRGP